VALMLAGLAVRIILTATTLGTNDAVFMIVYANLAERFGIAHAYVREHGLNHPPLSLLLFQWMARTARMLSIEYTDVLRLVQSAADCVTAAALVGIGRFTNVPARRLALLFFLCPAAIFISAFHCNTDATMVALITCGVLFAIRGRAAAAGLLIGLACGIKIVPLFVVPFFFLFLQRRFRFVAAFGATLAAIFVPPVVIAGPAVLRSVFGYDAYSGKWGVTALLLTLQRHAGGAIADRLFQWALWYANFGKFVLLAILVALFFAYFNRALKVDETERLQLLLTAVPITYLVVLFFAPGFGVQYVDWALPLLAFALPRRWTYAVLAAVSAYLFVAYTIWSGGFPWWYADSIAPSTLKPWVTLLGIPVWLFIGVAIVVATRRAFSSSEPSAARSA
jgi:hypothetical protein